MLSYPWQRSRERAVLLSSLWQRLGETESAREDGWRWEVTLVERVDGVGEVAMVGVFWKRILGKGNKCESERGFRGCATRATARILPFLILIMEKYFV